MNKRCGFWLIVLLGIASILSAENSSEATPNESESFFYFSWNPLAIASFFKMGYYTSVLPGFSNLEAGGAFGVGYFDSPNLYEMRFSLGNANLYNVIVQLQGSYLFFIGEYFKFLKRGLYCGLSISMLSVSNLYSEDITSHVYPAINIGWCLDIGRFFIDLRVNNMFAVYSWSSIPHSTPGFEFAFSPLTGISPYLPIVLLQIGYRI